MSQRTRKILPILSFRSIPGVDGGETMLTVHPPDEGHINKYSAWVGGCCVGTSNHMDIACELLLEQAKATCRRLIEESNRTLMLYSKELDQLNKEGLTSR